MIEIVILGSAFAVADEIRENTHLALVNEHRIVMVDCGGNPVRRLKQAHLDVHRITDLVLTHFHPDHVSGLPLLLMDLWLMGRKDVLRIHGLAHTIDRAETMMNLFDWQRWPGFFPVRYERVEGQENSPVCVYDDLRISSSPGEHMLPSIGLRFEFPVEKKIIVYSSDTMPCDSITRLARRADVLIHEASGGNTGHSSAAAAGEVGKIAEAGALYLIHYPPHVSAQVLIEAASHTFGKPVNLAEDLMRINVV